MKRRRVSFRPLAEADLLEIYRYIAEKAGRGAAGGYIDRIETACMALETFPERGTRRDDIRPGLRIIGFERRVAIAFMVEVDRVTILRLFYGGRDWEASFG